MKIKVAEISYQVFQFKDGSYLAGSDQDGIKATTRIIYAVPVTANSTLYRDYFQGELVTIKLEADK